MENPTFSDEQKEEIKVVVQEALIEYFEKKGATVKNVMVTVAILIGAVTVIFGGLKEILMFVGFNYVGK